MYVACSADRAKSNNHRKVILCWEQAKQHSYYILKEGADRFVVCSLFIFQCIKGRHGILPAKAGGIPVAVRYRFVLLLHWNMENRIIYNVAY